MSFVFFFKIFSNTFILYWLFFCTGFLSILKSFFTPSIQAALPNVVRKSDLATANTINQTIIQFSTFVGQGVGGLLYKTLGVSTLFLIDGISYLFSGILSFFVKIPPELPQSLKTKAILLDLNKNTIDGVKFLWHDKGLKSMVIVAFLLNFFISPIIVILPFHVVDTLKVSLNWYGLLLAIFGIGNALKC